MLFKTVPPSGKYKDDAIYFTLVKYIERKEATPSDLIGCWGIENKKRISEEMYELAKSYNKLKGTRVRHMIFSFDSKKEPHINAVAAFHIGKLIGDFYYPDYQIVYAVHENTENLHIHMVMNTVHRFTGKKHKGKKDDYYRFQDHIRKTIRKFGLRLYIEK